MVDLVLFVIRSFSQCLHVILYNVNIPVSLESDARIQMIDVFLFFFILGAFIKFFAIITHRSTYSKKD